MHVAERVTKDPPLQVHVVRGCLELSRAVKVASPDATGSRAHHDLPPKVSGRNPSPVVAKSESPQSSAERIPTVGDVQSALQHAQMSGCAQFLPNLLLSLAESQNVDFAAVHLLPSWDRAVRSAIHRAL